MGIYNDVVNLVSPSQGGKSDAAPYQVRELQIKKQLALADALRSASTSDIPVQSSGGIQAPISWASVLAKSLEGLGANLQDKRAEAGTKEVAESDRQSMRDTLAAYFKSQQAGGGGLAQPQAIATAQPDAAGPNIAQSFADAANAVPGQNAPPPNPLAATATPQPGGASPPPLAGAPPAALPPQGGPPGVPPNPTMPGGPVPSGSSQGSSDDALIDALTNPGGSRSAALQGALIPKVIEQRDAVQMLNGMDLTGIPASDVRFAKVLAAKGDLKGAIASLQKAQEYHYTGGKVFQAGKRIGGNDETRILKPEEYPKYNITPEMAAALPPGTALQIDSNNKITPMKAGDMLSEGRFAQDVALTGQRADATAAAQTGNIVSPTVDTNSASLNAVTGLPQLAIDRLMSAPNQPRGGAIVSKIDDLLTKYSVNNNINLATMRARAEGVQKTITQNTVRNNQARILDGELSGSIETLSPLLDQMAQGKVNKANVLSAWAGKQVNDPVVQQYSDQLQRLRAELAGYNAVAGGHLNDNGAPAPTPKDYDAADATLSAGINAGGAKAIGQSVAMSQQKNKAVLEKAIDDANYDLWDALGVGKHYKSTIKAPAKAPQPKGPPPRPAGVPSNWTLHTDAKGNQAYVSPDRKQYQEVAP